MKNLAVAPSIAPVEFNLTVLNGKEKGSVYRLMAPEITIGRGSDCDISFPEDPTCSRKHAKISFAQDGFVIESLSDKNALTVDGAAVQKAKLNDSSEIELGNTKLRFSIVRNELATQAHPHPNSMSPASPRGMGPASPSAGAWPGANPHHTPRPRAKKKKLLNPVRVIMIIVGVLFLYLMLSESPQQKKAVGLRTEQQRQADIEEANRLKEAALEEKRTKQVATQAYHEAQAAYVRGFRDYKKGIFGRAMESFQACLSLVPTHQLCTRYLRLSQRRFNELAQYHMVLGRKYRDQNQFSACESAFSNVMTMIRDQNNKTYQEAKVNYEACHAQLEDRF